MSDTQPDSDNPEWAWGEMPEVNALDEVMDDLQTAWEKTNSVIELLQDLNQGREMTQREIQSRLNKALEGREALMAAHETLEEYKYADAPPVQERLGGDADE